MKMRSCLLAVRQVPVVLLVGVAVLGLNSPVQAAEINVPAGGDIQAAIDAADPGDVIQLEPGEYLPATTIYIDGTKNLTIRGVVDEADAPISSINGMGAIRVFECVGTAEIIVENVLITNGFYAQVNVNDIGGGLYCSNSNLTLENCTFNENEATDYGGAMYIYYSSPTLNDCTFTGNSSTYGAGVFNDWGEPVFTDCSFLNNMATFHGGGIYCTGDYLSLTFTDCVFEGNSAERNGGGVSCESPNAQGLTCEPWMDLSFTNCQFERNRAGRDGGGAWHLTATAVYTECEFVENEAGLAGGAVLTAKSSRTIAYSACEFSSNTAGESGGGIYHSFSDPGLCADQLIEIESCIFTSNVAKCGFGGGVFITGVRDLSISNSIFKNNESGTECDASGNSSRGGGAVYQQIGNATLTGSHFEGNVVQNGNGGGASLSTGGESKYFIQIEFCTFDSNQVNVTELEYSDTGIAKRGGGGLYMGGNGSVMCTLFSGNSALREPTASYAKGGGVYADFGLMAFNRCRFTANSVVDGGGGIYCTERASEGSTITQCTVADCSAITGRGAIELNSNASGGIGGGTFSPAYTLSNNVICGNGTDPIGGNAGNEFCECWIDGGGNLILETCGPVGDINLDGVVDGQDLALLLADWGCTGFECSADLTLDGLVNGQDLAQLLGDWS